MIREGYGWLVRKLRSGRDEHRRGTGSGGVEPATAEREIGFWAHRVQTLQPNFWDTYAQDPQAVAKSRRIVDTLKELDLPADFSLHEFGCNLGRNLWYIRQAFPHARLSGNDVNPLAPAKCAEYFGRFAEEVRIELVATQDFVRRAATAGLTVDVCLSADHFIHVPDDSLEILATFVPRVVARYLVLRESAGTHERHSEWYRRWTTNDAVHWFDRDYVKLFERLRCIKKVEDHRTASGKVYAVYVFEQDEGRRPTPRDAREGPR